MCCPVELASSLMATREKKSKRDETEHKSLFQNPSENRNEASTLSDEKEGTAELNIELKELTELQCLLRSVLNQDIA